MLYDEGKPLASPAETQKPAAQATPYTPAILRRDQEYIKWAEDSTPEMEHLRLTLLAKRVVTRYDSEGNPTRYLEDTPGVEPWMTEEGVNTVLGLIYPYLTKDAKLANIPAARLAKITLAFGNNLNFVVGTNAKRWKLRSEFQRMLVNQATHMVHLSLSRGVDNKERDWTGQQNYRQEVVNTQTQPNTPKKGIFPF